MSMAAVGGNTCSDSCGWIWALVSACSYGTYGVPIKIAKKANNDCHPFVLQSYKILVVFACSWLVLLFGAPLRFSPWGLVSGFVWVLGGTCGIYGIQTVGMAVAVGTWSATMVIMNFVWGILLFQEPVQSKLETGFCFLLLVAGLIGMSRYSVAEEDSKNNAVLEDGANDEELHMQANSYVMPTASLDDHEASPTRRRPHGDPIANEEDVDDSQINSDHELDNDMEPLLLPSLETSASSNGVDSREHGRLKWLDGIPTRQLGLLCSIGNGLLSGSSLIPLHYAKRQGFGGMNYILSLSCGALAANALLWLCFALGTYAVQPRGVTLVQSCRQLPSWNFGQLWKPGFLAGILLGMGMCGNILATTTLGQGIGNSLTQTKIIISGLWGIFYFREIRERWTVIKWFGSAFLCALSIVWLSQERTSVPRRDSEM